MTATPRAIIFTALPVETDAVVRHLYDVKSVCWGEDVYRLGRFEEGPGWDVLVVETGAENPDAGIETDAGLRSFEPAVAIFAGVGGGIAKKKVALFDVVVPQRVDYYHAGAAEDEFTFRPRQEHPSHYMTSAAREIARTGLWLARLEPGPEREPKVHLGPIASGEHVVKSLKSETYEFIRAKLDQTVAVDMESSGFLRAASRRSGLQYAVVRGVSDLLSDKEEEADESRQPEAARRAAAFALELLATMRQDVLKVEELRVPPSPWGATTRQDGHVSGEQERVAIEEVGGPDAEGAVALGQELTELLDLDHWSRQTESIFFGSPPAITVEFDERLRSARAWAEARVATPGLDRVLAAVSNLAAILRDFIDVFHSEVDTSPDGHFLRVQQFYRRYELPIIEREKLIVEYERHNLLIKDLGVEMTRAVNLIGDRIRELEPRYRTARGAAGIFAGPDEDFMVVAYDEKERELAAPYPGLDGFQEVLPGRDGSFGPYRARNDWPDDALRRLEGALAEDNLAAAHLAAFDFAALVADLVPAREPIVVVGGPRGGHPVRFLPVTVRWRSPDDSRLGAPVRHLTRTYLTPRGEPDTRRERLVGAPEGRPVGEVLDGDASIILEPLRDSDIAPFAAEARKLLRKIDGEPVND